MTNAPHIKIYTDGSRLQKAILNPSGAGGWGAVIIAGDQVRTLSGTVPTEMTSAETENLAIIQALQSVRDTEWQQEPKSTVTLYTDQRDLVRRLPGWIRGDTLSLRPSHHDIVALAREMNVAFKGAQVTDPAAFRLREAHVQANTAAWMSRLEKQGYVNLRGNLIQGEEAPDAIRAYCEHSSRGPRHGRG